MLNKKEKEQLVIKLFKENKTIQEIAEKVHVSFRDFSAIIRRIDGGDANYPNNKSKDTQALYLFSHGKTPLDVAIELELSASEVIAQQIEYWKLRHLHELATPYDDNIKNYLSIILEVV
jgi:hypothetical protein